MFAGISIILVFLVMAVLMMSRRLPALLALPLMALGVGLISGVAYPWSAQEEGLGRFLGETILTQGSTKLAQAMMFTIFGSILSQVVMRLGIAARLVGLTAEYAGQHKGRLALLLTAITAICFTSVTGLGAVIMIGSLVLPIMIGAGLSAPLAAGLMLFAIALGGVFNPAILGFYMDVLQLPQATVQSYVAAYGALLGLTTLVFWGVGCYRERQSFNWAQVETPSAPAVPWWSLITPILPIALILGCDLPIIPAFAVGIVWGVLSVAPRQAVQNLSAATLEGLKDVAPVLGLFIGLGMCLNAMTATPTKVVMEPLLEAVIPTSPWGFTLFFFLLAPLALYRGPLNMYGLGAGVAGILLGSQFLPPTAILAAFFSVGQVQGVCDPTNTQNVWLAQFTKTTTERLLKDTLPYVWAFVALALLWATFVAGALNWPS